MNCETCSHSDTYPKTLVRFRNKFQKILCTECYCEYMCIVYGTFDFSFNVDISEYEQEKTDAVD